MYPTQPETVLVDLQLRGWQSLGSLLVHRIVHFVYLCLLLLITQGWPPCKLSLLPFHFDFKSKYSILFLLVLLLLTRFSLESLIIFQCDFASPLGYSLFNFFLLPKEQFAASSLTIVATQVLSARHYVHKAMLPHSDFFSRWRV
jgi:hypothetical protein